MSYPTVKTVTVLMLAVWLFAGETAAQDSSAQIASRLERQLRQTEIDYALRINPVMSVGERAMIDYGALVSYGFLAVDDTDQNTRILRQADIQLYGYLNLDGVHEFFGRARFTHLDFNSGDSFDGAGDRWVHPFYDRLWYRFDLRRAIEAYQGQYSPNNLRVQVGRQYVEWASGMALSEQLYAALVDVEIAQWFDARFLVGQTPSSSVIDFDSSRPSFDGETRRLFIGGQLTLTRFRDHKPYMYVLSQTDRNRENQSVPTFQIAPPPFPATPVPTRHEYDSIYWGIGSTGNLMPKLRYEVEGIYQTGRGMSNSYDPDTLDVPPPVGTFQQTKEDISAWAARGQLTYLMLDDNMTKFELETVVASGDSDRDLSTSNTFGGNKSGTTDKAFNAFGFINTGLAFAPPVSNLTMIRLGASTFPIRDSNLFRRLQVGTDVFVYGKTNPNAPLDEATSNDWFLGWEVDVYANWRLASDLAVFVRYGVFFPGEAINADKDERHYFYTGLTYSF